MGFLKPKTPAAPKVKAIEPPKIPKFEVPELPPPVVPPPAVVAEGITADEEKERLLKKQAKRKGLQKTVLAGEGEYGGSADVGGGKTILG